MAEQQEEQRQHVVQEFVLLPSGAWQLSRWGGRGPAAWGGGTRCPVSSAGCLLHKGPLLALARTRSPLRTCTKQGGCAHSGSQEGHGPRQPAGAGAAGAQLEGTGIGSGGA